MQSPQPSIFEFGSRYDVADDIKELSQFAWVVRNRFADNCIPDIIYNKIKTLSYEDELLTEFLLKAIEIMPELIVLNEHMINAFILKNFKRVMLVLACAENSVAMRKFSTIFLSGNNSMLDEYAKSIILANPTQTFIEDDDELITQINNRYPHSETSDDDDNNTLHESITNTQQPTKIKSHPDDVYNINEKSKEMIMDMFIQYPTHTYNLIKDNLVHYNIDKHDIDTAIMKFDFEKYPACINFIYPFTLPESIDELYIQLIKNCKYHFASAIANFIDIPDEVCCVAMRRNIIGLNHLPYHMRTYNVCREVMKIAPDMMYYVPIIHRTRELLFIAGRVCNRPLKYFPIFYANLFRDYGSENCLNIIQNEIKHSGATRAQILLKFYIKAEEWTKNKTLFANAGVHQDVLSHIFKYV